MKRHNAAIARIRQHELAGQIALMTNAINPYLASGRIAPVYDHNGVLSLSVIGQDYLRQLGLRAREM